MSAGQEAQFSISNVSYMAIVDKIYPEMSGGTFEVGLIFDDDVPTAVRRGQSLQLNLTLSKSPQSLILPIGGFVQDVHGTWVFVLDENAEYAAGREKRLGRRNNRFLEIQEGLQEGEKVTTSSYNQKAVMERIITQ